MKNVHAFALTRGGDCGALCFLGQHNQPAIHFHRAAQCLPAQRRVTPVMEGKGAATGIGVEFYGQRVSGLEAYPGLDLSAFGVVIVHFPLITAPILQKASLPLPEIQTTTRDNSDGWHGSIIF